MTRRHRVFLVLLAAFALAGLGACGSGGGGGGSCPAKVDTRAAVGGAVTICAADIHFDVSTITAPAGKLTITLENRGSILHTFKLEGTSLELKANGGKSATGTATLAKGTYSFECTVPGHATAGMKGKLVVG